MVRGTGGHLEVLLAVLSARPESGFPFNGSNRFPIRLFTDGGRVKRQ
jgi:hypothetical protein